MASEYAYRFTEKAEQDLDEILHYIAVDLDNPIASKGFFEKVFDKIATVRYFPESGALVDNEFLSDKTVRKLLVDQYVIYYKVFHDQKMLYIVRILYGKRNLDEILRQI
jgi:plasmid stabilization system protein ParE